MGSVWNVRIKRLDVETSWSGFERAHTPLDHPIYDPNRLQVCYAKLLIDEFTKVLFQRFS